MTQLCTLRNLICLQIPCSSTIYTIMKKLRIYLDTSVIGGCFDDEVKGYSNKLFENIKTGKLIGVLSNIVQDELLEVPENVKEVILSLPQENIIRVQSTSEMEDLTEKDLKEHIVTLKYKNDALHIAIATVLNIEVLVSWNFKHIVNFQKIKQFNAVNLREGYSPLEIRTPMEVML